MKPEEILQSKFCLHLKEVRQGKGMSFGDLEATSDVNRSDICNIEKCAKNPKLTKLVMLADGLNGELRIVPKEENERKRKISI